MAIFRRSACAAKACLGLMLGGWLALAQAGATHHVRLLPNGQLVGQGDNHFGQVQPGLPAEVKRPQTLKLPARQWRAVATGGRHSVAIDAAGRVWTWGDNSSGQLGLGHTRPVQKAQRVVSLSRQAVAVAAGMQHSVAQLSDGSIWAWGANNQGQLGTGAATDAGSGSGSVSTAAAVAAFAVTPLPVRVVAPPPGMRSALAAGRVMAAKPLIATAAPVAAPTAVAASDRAPVVKAPAADRPAAVAPVQVAPVADAKPPMAAAKPPVAAPVVPAAAELLVTGTVLLSGTPLPDVQVVAAAARCSSTDKQGRYVCKVAPGWSGKISLQRNNYQFSPNALSLQDVRTTVGQQDFAAIYEPR